MPIDRKPTKNEYLSIVNLRKSLCQTNRQIVSENESNRWDSRLTQQNVENILILPRRYPNDLHFHAWNPKTVNYFAQTSMFDSRWQPLLNELMAVPVKVRARNCFGAIECHLFIIVAAKPKKDNTQRRFKPILGIANAVGLIAPPFDEKLHATDSRSHSNRLMNPWIIAINFLWSSGTDCGVVAASTWFGVWGMREYRHLFGAICAISFFAYQFFD